MRSKRNSYSGRRRVEPEATINRRRERATQRAKQKDEIVETPHESVNDKSQISIRKTEERGCFWMLSMFCIMTIFTALIAFVVHMYLTDVDPQSNQIWRDWRFIVPFLVFSSVIFLGLRDSQLRFLLAFPFTVLAALFVYMIWIDGSGDTLNANLSTFWRDWRFIIPLVLFNSQAFLGMKEGSDSCVAKLFTFCFVFPLIFLPVLMVYYLLSGTIFGVQELWNWQCTILLILTYCLTFLRIFGFLGKWITSLDRKITTAFRKGKD